MKTRESKCQGTTGRQARPCDTSEAQSPIFNCVVLEEAAVRPWHPHEHMRIVTRMLGKAPAAPANPSTELQPALGEAQSCTSAQPGFSAGLSSETRAASQS